MAGNGDGVYTMRANSINCIGELSLANGGFKKIYDNTLSSAASSVTISGLDGDNDEVYLLRVVGKGTASASIRLRFNNDSGANYGLQYLTASNTTLTAGRSTSSTAMAIASVDASSGVAYGEAFICAKSGKVRTLLISHTERVNGSTIDTLQNKAQSWNNMSSNITALVISASSGNMDVGTRIELWRKI